MNIVIKSLATFTLAAGIAVGSAGVAGAGDGDNATSGTPSAAATRGDDTGTWRMDRPSRDNTGTWRVSPQPKWKWINMHDGGTMFDCFVPVAQSSC